MFSRLFQPRAFHKIASSIETVLLKNGSKVEKNTLVVVMNSIDSLEQKNPLAFFDLVEKCRNPTHNLFYHDEINKLGLLNNGKCTGVIKDIVLSSAEGEGLDMARTFPVMKNDSPKKGMS